MTPSAANRSRSAADGRKRPSAPRFPVVGALTAPGTCPARGSTGSTSPRYRSAARASSTTPGPVRASAATPSASSVGSRARGQDDVARLRA